MKNFFTPKRILAFILTAVLIAVSVPLFLNKRVLAVFNENSAVRYSQFSATHTVEDSTLFVGTYLINIEGMTDAVYEKAQSSASESNQTTIYYKSELANGQWFDVSDAEGLSDIMSTGTPVSDAEIADLFVQYYVGKDGVLHDAKTDAAQNPFNTPDPYDLKKLPELQTLWLQYANSTEADSITQDEYLKNKNSDQSGNKRTDVYNYQFLTAFFSLDLRDGDTDKYDADIDRLYACYLTLKSQGEDEEAAIIYDLMEKVDASRRMIVMRKLSGDDPNCLGTLYNMLNGDFYTSFGDFKNSDNDDNTASYPEYIRTLEDAARHYFSDKDGTNGWWQPLQKTYDTYNDKEAEERPTDAFKPDSSILDAVNDGQSQCQTSYNNYNSNALSDVDTVLGHAQYEYSTQVIDQASADGSTGPINYLIDAQNIAESRIKDSESELNLLDSTLIGLAEDRYSSRVTSGASDEYRSTMSSTGPAAAKSVLDQQEGDLEASRTELEFLIDALKQREKAADALSYVNTCINWTNGLYSGIPNDDFSSSATGSVDSHIAWLKNLSSQIKDSDESLKTNLDKLKEEKEELQKKRDAALDDNDLAGARKIDAQIAAKDRDIADEEARTGKSSSDSLAENILDDTLNKLAADPDADISGALGALSGMGATDAIDRIAGRAEAAGTSSETLNNIDSAKADAAANAGNMGSTGGSGSQAGAGGASGSGTSQSGLTENEIIALIAGALGEDAADTVRNGTGAGNRTGAGSGAGTGTGTGAAAGTGSGTGSGSGAGAAAGTSSGAVSGTGNISASDAAALAAALSKLAQTGNIPAGTLTQRMAEMMRLGRNRYLFSQYNVKTPEYVSLETIGDCTDYRYLYDNSRKTATMTKGLSSIRLQTGSTLFTRNGGANEQLKEKIVYYKVPYISADDAKDIFGCDVEYLNGTAYGICLPAKVKAKADELYAVFTGN